MGCDAQLAFLWELFLGECPEGILRRMSAGNCPVGLCLGNFSNRR